MFLDGRALAKEIKMELKKEIRSNDYYPTLAIVQIGLKEESTIYIQHKLKACQLVGITTRLINFPDHIPEKKLLCEIDKLNDDMEVNGIIVQLPIPEGISVKNVLSRIKPEKDVDGFHPYNTGLLSIGNYRKTLLPATPAGIVDLVDRALEIKGQENLAGKVVCVVGQSHIVGRPVSVLMQNRGATVIMCDINTKDTAKNCRMADIIISATGVSGIIDENCFKNDYSETIVIDAGIARSDDKIVGDVDRRIYGSHKNLLITPVPGGVGPMTIAKLCQNTLKAYTEQNKKSVPLSEAEISA